MSAARFSLPAADELEVSVFGPGKGECIVVGLPGGPWFVVDSFQVRVPGGRSPIAIEYLNRIKVSDVAGVFITHWHDDHTRGAAEVLKRYATTLRYIALPNGFAEEFLASFIADLLPNHHRFKLVADLAQVITAIKNDPLLKAPTVHKTTLANLSTFPFGSDRVVYALSPSLADQQHQSARIATYLPGWRGPKPRKYDINSGCAVLKLVCGQLRVLLGSDLDVGDTDDRGWRSIALAYGAELSAHVFKVGHHGSETAFHPPALNAMDSPNVHAAVTPFPARNEHLPREAMLRKYRPMFRTLHVTARHTARGRAGGVPLKDTPFRSYIKTTAGAFDAIGHIRFRIKTTDASVRTELFGGARNA